MSMYSLQESLTKVEESSIGALSVGLEEQVQKIAAMKEEYLTRRKLLSSVVKKFSSEYLTQVDNVR